MTMRAKKAVVRALAILLAYALLGPVWYARTVTRNGEVTEYKRLGMFKWMELEKYYFIQNPDLKKGGAFIRKPGVAATMVCYFLLFGVVVRFETKWKEQGVSSV
jgi:hypothetical protein